MLFCASDLAALMTGDILMVDGHVQWVRGGKNYVFSYELGQDENRSSP